ncbi:hypothetical protein [Paraburkholderia sp. SARCC-3016]|uniref:hypothetical protein n=1 Tax=Paraburkholderia sp. SARCC-3016 TaxID=3058611 RepID=UPI00280A9404|nr:hypothetical protein [Paraburkholderia sp. SARCC-3016]
MATPWRFESSPGHQQIQKKAGKIAGLFHFPFLISASHHLHRRSGKPKSARHLLLLTRRDTERRRNLAPLSHDPPLPLDDLSRRFRAHAKIRRYLERQLQIHKSDRSHVVL